MLELARSALGDRYSIDREIGRGGLGTVFLATDTLLERTVALKLVWQDITDTLGHRAILRELAFAARLNHPHILPILKAEETQGQVYYVSPYITGGSSSWPGW